MHIPTHQIHNVLNAYAKRLKKIHDAANGKTGKGPEDPFSKYSAEDKRRFIINKISADIVDKIIRSKPNIKQTKTDTAPGGQPDRRGLSEKDLQTDVKTELIRYHILTENGKKVSATMKILDPDFLITQLEEIARKSSEK